jgi:hypothetical protein
MEASGHGSVTQTRRHKHRRQSVTARATGKISQSVNQSFIAWLKSRA